MAAKLAPAKLQGAAPLKPEEVKLVEDAALTRPRSAWARFWHAMAKAAKVITFPEFERVCLMVHKDLDGAVMHPEEAAAKAKRIIEAATEAHCTVRIPKCTCCDIAIMVVWLGEPGAGFLFQRHLKLKDPKAAARG